MTWVAYRRVLFGRAAGSKQQNSATSANQRSQRAITAQRPSRRPFVSHTGCSQRATRMPTGAVVVLGSLEAWRRETPSPGVRALMRVVKHKRNYSRAPQERRETPTPRPPRPPHLFVFLLKCREPSQAKPSRSHPGSQSRPPRTASPMDARRAKRKTHKWHPHWPPLPLSPLCRPQEGEEEVEGGREKKPRIFLANWESSGSQNLGLRAWIVLPRPTDLGSTLIVSASLHRQGGRVNRWAIRRGQHCARLRLYVCIWDGHD